VWTGRLGSSTAGCPGPGCCIPIPRSALPPDIEVRAVCVSSARKDLCGAISDGRAYRDPSMPSPPFDTFDKAVPLRPSPSTPLRPPKNSIRWFRSFRVPTENANFSCSFPVQGTGEPERSGGVHHIFNRIQWLIPWARANRSRELLEAPHEIHFRREHRAVQWRLGTIVPNSGQRPDVHCPLKRSRPISKSSGRGANKEAIVERSRCPGTGL